MKSVTIFGGSGYVGGSFYDYFLKNKIYNSLNLVSRTVKQKLKPNKSVKLIKYDLEMNYGDKLPSKSDLVFYAIDNTDYDLYKQQTFGVLPLKAKNFINLVKEKYSKSKIIFISSGSVYGCFNKKIKTDENFQQIIEDNLPMQKKSYIENKRIIEKEFLKLGKEGYKVSIARCFTFLGPRIPLDKHFLIGNFIQNFINKKKIFAKSKQQVIRSYMYSEDMVEWLMTIGNISSTECPIYNVGSDIELSIDNILETFKEFGAKISVRQNITNDLDYYVPNVDKAKFDLNLKFSNDFKLNLIKTINDVKNNL